MPQVSSQVIGQVSLLPFRSGWVIGWVIHLLSWCIGWVTTLPLILQSSMVSFLISVLANEDLLKLVLECLELMISAWKRDHPSDNEDDTGWVVQWGWGGGPGCCMWGVQTRVCWSCSCTGRVPAAALVEPHPAGDKGVVKKRSLKWVKQQVSALLCGEDLPEGAQAREVAEVPFQVPAVPRETKDCLVCQQSFKHTTVHMGVHRGEKYPCDKCVKVLGSKDMWTRHTSTCVWGCKVACSDCGKQYASSQGMK